MKIINYLNFIYFNWLNDNDAYKIKIQEFNFIRVC